MKRTIPVARTAPDLEHANRVRAATFGVRELRLKLGDKLSKSHVADHAPPFADEKGTNDFHFAPKEEKPKIHFTLDDRATQVTKATLELFRRGAKAADWTKELEAVDRGHGEHEIEWDGKIDKTDEFPEQYITAEHSPYKLKLTIEGSGKSDSLVAWTYFHVLIHSFKLELGEKDVLARDADKALWDVLKADGGSSAGAVPEDGKTREVKLVSNLFSTGDDKENNTAYSAYKTLWGDGPRIPIFAKLLLKKSDDKEVEVPEAVGKVRLQWDYEDQQEDLSRHFTEGKEYLEASLDRYKDSTKPKGDNCHKDHGGKRGDTGKTLFPSQAGTKPGDAVEAGKFPFKVEGGATRKWASYSEAWATGKLKGRSGVLFEPSRMAGDAVKLVVRFPYVRKPDGKDEIDTEDEKLLKHSVSHTTGTFQVWREVHLIKYLKKHASITEINLGTVGGYYDKAWIKLVDKSGGASTTMPDYDKKLRAEVKKQPELRRYALDAGDQGSGTQSAALFASVDDFMTEAEAKTGWAKAKVVKWIQKNAADWEEFLESIADAVIPPACDPFLSAQEGINILQFNKYWESSDGFESSTNGFASTSFPSMGLTKAAYLQTRMNYGAGHNNMQQTTTHEIGHILFLPHAPGNAGGDARFHDDTGHWNNCTMSYEYDRERKFCGLCLLRLRGWDQTNLDKDRAKNKKT